MKPIHVVNVMAPKRIPAILVLEVEKLDVHQRGLRHKAVSVFLISENSILLQKRASMKYHTPGLWANTCCTHPSWSEDPIDCAHRRLKEELGIEVSELVYKDKIDYIIY